MAQIVEFQEKIIKINPKNRKELLVKDKRTRKFNLLKNFKVEIHYLLCAKYQIILFSEKGFYSSLDIFADDWLNFTKL